MITVIIPFGCALGWNPAINYDGPADTGGVVRWVADEIESVPDTEIDHRWQTPQETLDRGKGDCEDHAILAAHILTQQGHEAYIVIGWLVIDDHWYHHAWLRVGETHYEPTTGFAFDSMLGDIDYRPRQEWRYRL
jgi:hypothetical protein